MTKKTKVTIAFLLFFTVSIADIFAVVTSNKTMEVIFKPLLMITLIIVYLVSIKKPSMWLLLGLVFSFLGDVFLLNQEEYFVYGVACFLIAHVLYIRLIAWYIKGKPLMKGLLSILPFILPFLLTMYVVYDNLKDMVVPVFEYGFVIAVFGAVTLLNYQQEKSKANLLILLSSVVLMFSDAFIILNIYHSYSKILDFFVILFYISSQFLIVRGMILKEETPKI